MIIFFIKDLTRNPENRNTPAWVFSNIIRLDQVRDTKFCINGPNKWLNNTRFTASTLPGLLVEKVKDEGKNPTVLSGIMYSCIVLLLVKVISAITYNKIYKYFNQISIFSQYLLVLHTQSLEWGFRRLPS